MDYVVFGIGMGASLVVFGLAGRTIGPSLRYRRSRETGDVLRAEELVARVAWSRFCGSLGAAIALGGLLLLIVTGTSMAMRVSDSTAAIGVGLALVAIVVLMMLWTWAFVDRFGLYGIVAERRRVVTSSLSSGTEDDAEIVPPIAKLDDTPDDVDQPQVGQPRTASSREEIPAQPIIGPVFPRAVETVPAASGVDISRSEVVNPSDAEALERILNSPDADLSAPETVETVAEADTVDTEPAIVDPAVAEGTVGEDDLPDETPSDESEQDPEVPAPAAPTNGAKQQGQ